MSMPRTPAPPKSLAQPPKDGPCKLDGVAAIDYYLVAREPLHAVAAAMRDLVIETV